jgi:hypothetical protein
MTPVLVACLLVLIGVAWGIVHLWGWGGAAGSNRRGWPRHVLDEG